MRTYAMVLIALLGFWGMPISVQAQEIIPVTIEIEGELTYEDVDGNGTSEVLIDDVIIVPPPGFDALQYPEGQQIIIVGTLLPDNSIHTISFIRAEATPEPQQTASPQATVAPDDDDNDDDDDKQQEEREREEEKRQEELAREEEKRQEELEREEEKRQEELEREEERRPEEVEITGEITSVTQNSIVVNGETIEGGGIFQPGQQEAGQFVRVIGVRENNGRIKPTEIEFLTAEEAQAQATHVPTQQVPPCVADEHLIVTVLAEEFALDPSEVVALHCRDNLSFADIARALLLNEATGQPTQTFLDAFTQGMDWGQIARNAGLDPAVIASGRVLVGD